MADAPWWNSNFKIRRSINVSARLFSDDEHLLIQLADGFVGSYKTRTDLQDIEVVYFDTLTEVSHVLASFAEIQTDGEEEFLNIQFARHTGQLSASTDYYLYMANQSMVGINYLRPLLPLEQGYYIKPGAPGAYYTSLLDATPSTPIPSYPGDYSSLIFYSQEAELANSSRFTVTRPTEDWINGVSTRQNAVATFIYSGGGAALRYEAGPDRGILRITTNGISTTLDTYSATRQYKLHYFDDDISSNYGFTHAFLVTGDKSPSSSGSTIKLDRMLYTHYDLVSLGSEELYDGGNIKRYVIGV